MMGLLAVLTPHFCVIRHSKYVTKSPFCYHTKGEKQKERRLRIPCSTTAQAISPEKAGAGVEPAPLLHGSPVVFHTYIGFSHLFLIPFLCIPSLKRLHK